MERAIDEAGLENAESDPGLACFLGVMSALAGRHDDAVRRLDPLSGLGDVPTFGGCEKSEINAWQALAWSLQQTGETGRADALLDEVERHAAELREVGIFERSDQLFDLARNAALLQQPDLAIERLERAIEAGWRNAYVERHDPRWGAVREDPRFHALMDRVREDVDAQRAEVARIEAERQAAD
jgi:hypothetical protein